MAGGKCVFNPLWLNKQNYKTWLSSTNDKHKAKCSLCNKEIGIGRMGEYAVEAHMHLISKQSSLRTWKAVSSFTLLFDETLNNSNQKKQLDVHARYWEPYDNKVVTTYFGSAF
ncbi:hypothetical protein AVEN_265709-1 [Araneus ventricosus]|uniref:Uncharacterized protein n=1 Tax=Araneus ventricosus TaxID=182803 RepID=A0A4Y2PS56_ARAVE|nr:hypothetical protein AVEN_265709-1 [Araneus ventricosus]